MSLSGSDSDGNIVRFRITDTANLNGVLYRDGLVDAGSAGRRHLVNASSGGSATV